MSDDAPLQRLAARCGIARRTVDWHGNERRVPDDTLRRLLAAMRVAAEDDAAVAASLHALDAEPWQRALDAVCVLRCDTPATVDVRLPSGTATLGWRIALEDGHTLEGSAAFGTLPLRDSNADTVKECRALELPGLAPGYHILTMEPDGSRMTLIATPAACWLPGEPGTTRLWGIALQLYLLRSERNWGIGDFTDLRELVAHMAQRGADVVGLNPLHAMFPDNPEHASPYSPSSRLLLNTLNIDVTALPELAASTAARALLERSEVAVRLARCRGSENVLYRDIAALKGPLLEVLFEEARSAGGARWRAFEAFRRERGALFERHCTFLALRAHFAAQSADHADWRRWPDEFRAVQSEAVTQFTREHANAVTYVAWLQWVADEQLAAAAAAADGMRIGLYGDLAVGADPAGAETWSEPKLAASGVHIGAPPDPMSEHGQDWGLPPVSPRELQASRYAGFVALLRANMRHVGALRIDHAMALRRLYWVPEGARPTEGAYVEYPLEDLLGIVALESYRNRCMVIGEDLGTVPPGFRERMAEANVLSYRVLTFERDEEGQPIPPDRYPELALAVFGNHDLPTLRGWWEARDIDLQAAHGQLQGEALAQRRAERDAEKRALLGAMRAAGVLGAEPAEPPPDELAVAVHALLARTRALLAMAQLDDAAREPDPVNVPSLPRNPNWRRRLGVPLERLAEDSLLDRIAAAFAAEGRARA